MKKISNYKDLLKVSTEIPMEFADYIEKEYKAIYEFLSYGEGLSEFTLPSHQSMIILEGDHEVRDVLNDKYQVEFVDKEYLGSYKCLRIGINQFNDIQLYYYLYESKKNPSMVV